MKNVIVLGKSLLISYGITAILLTIGAFVMLKAQVKQSQMMTFIYVVYAVANFVSGFILGKAKKEKKFLWGLAAGMVYFVVLSLISFVVNQGFYQNPVQAALALGASVVFGMIGGMAG